jgi:hypothetical protein
MRDLDIRRALRRHLTTAFGDDPSALILDELGVCRGMVRVDMAVVNGELKGFEIKSDRDTLGRLAAQASIYSRVFDTLSIVVGSRYLQKAEAIIPGWWGIWAVGNLENERAAFRCVRAESQNDDIDPYSLVQLLWREETLFLLEEHDLGAGLRSKPRRYLWDALARSLTIDDLRDSVRAQLKARQGWRSGESRRQDGGRSLPSARL